MDPPFLAVPVGGLIGHDALSDAGRRFLHGQVQRGHEVVVLLRHPSRRGRPREGAASPDS